MGVKEVIFGLKTSKLYVGEIVKTEECYDVLNDVEIRTVHYNPRKYVVCNKSPKHICSYKGMDKHYYKPKDSVFASFGEAVITSLVCASELSNKKRILYKDFDDMISHYKKFMLNKINVVLNY